MALVPCPECQHNVSDKAAQCPSCGYGVAAHFNPPFQTASSQETKLLVTPSGSGSSDEEKRFQTDALQIVTTCERALHSPRMMFSSILAEAEGMLGALRVNYRNQLSAEKHINVEPYLVGLIGMTKLVQEADESCAGLGGEGLAGLLNASNSKLLMNQAMRRPRAYMHDLRIILGAAYGTVGEVERLHRNLDRVGKKTAKGSGCLVLLAGMLAFSCCVAFGIVLL
jgi:hypothetical protein